MRSQADSLAFAAGQRAGRTGQGEIFQSHAFQKAQTGTDFFQDGGGDSGIAAGKLQMLEEIQRIGNRQITQLGDIQTAHCDCQTDRRQPLSMAGITGMALI